MSLDYISRPIYSVSCMSHGGMTASTPCLIPCVRLPEEAIHSKGDVLLLYVLEYSVEEDPFLVFYEMAFKIAVKFPGGA